MEKGEKIHVEGTRIRLKKLDTNAGDYYEIYEKDTYCAVTLKKGTLRAMLQHLETDIDELEVDN